MNRKKIGLLSLINTIGEEFFNKHKDRACFSYGEEEKGLFCFLGFDMSDHTSSGMILSSNIDEWSYYATCYVKKDGTVLLDKCKIPESQKEDD